MPGLTISAKSRFPARLGDAEVVPRHASTLLTESIEDSPVTLIQGPRQSGKTTLAQLVGEPLGYLYLNFDDDVTRTTALNDPAGFVGDLPERVVLDEVQRVPSLFSALKIAVDRMRTPGRFVLTGSSNILLDARLSDSLAGRMQVVRLHPLSQWEIERSASSTFVERLFQEAFDVRHTERLSGNLAERIVAGGYPAAMARPPGHRRSAWYRSYVSSMIQRDVRDIASIRSVDVVSKLLAAAAAQNGQLFNVSELASPFQVSRNTIRDYFILIERLFLAERLPAWHSNRMSRLVKAPKVHFGDTGLACSLMGADRESLQANRTVLGRVLETFVLQELRRQASGLPGPYSFFHFRDRDKAEVDVVIEHGSLHVAGVEVKASATVFPSDFSGLRKLKAACGSRFGCGVVLYDGEVSVPFGEGLYAVPIRRLWDEG